MILCGFISIRLSLGARAFYIRARVRAPTAAGDVLTVRARTREPPFVGVYHALLYYTVSNIVISILRNISPCRRDRDCLKNADGNDGVEL